MNSPSQLDMSTDARPSRSRSGRSSVRLAAVLIAVGIGRIAATYPVFNNVYDEQLHLARGYLWWNGYAYAHPLHPPLAPLVLAAGPVLSGVAIEPTGDRFIDGNAILYSGNYWRTLSLARAGNLLFFVWGAVVVWLWCRDYADEWCGCISVAVFTLLPPVLAHAGLATTDLSITATLPTSIWLFQRWLDRCTWPRSISLGVGFGLTLLSKLSAVVFLPVCCLLVLLSSPRLRSASVSLRLLHVAAVSLVMIDVLWLGYRCSFGPTYARQIPEVRTLAASGSTAERLLDVSVPTPEFFQGLVMLYEKNAGGHAPYFLGDVDSERGNFAFFPTVITIKTPVPFLLLFVAGTWIACRGTSAAAWRIPFLCVFGILGVAMLSRINLGVRHVLPLYPMFCIGAGLGAVGLWRTLPGRVRWFVVLLMVWGFADSARAHPDYLAYFNPIAGRRPEEIVVDSDLDWGQDLIRLRDEVRRRRIETLYLVYFGTAAPEQHGLQNSKPLRPDQPVNGWVAVSLTSFKTNAGYAWLEDFEPVARIGRSILLFYVDPALRH